jgi:sugar lactone lactonase YvrE
MNDKFSVLLEGLAFPEGPRWRDGRLWFSDMHFHRVVAVDLKGRAETIVEVPNRPSGLGWLPDGRLLVVSMTDRKLLRLDAHGLVEHADLSDLASFHCNDMVVDGQGRAYVGNFGFDSSAREDFKTAEIVMAEPDGNVVVVADGLAFPNGTVITPDGRTLIVAESRGQRLTAFDVAPDGLLSGRREWAALPGAAPDGICLDVEGAIWVAAATSSEVLRVRAGGEVTHRLPVSTQAFACMLGGPDRRTLFVCTAESSDRDETRARAGGRIEFAEVEFQGTGLP